MDIFLIILTVVFSIILISTNFYILVIYIHPDDKGIGNNVMMKIMVILGLTLCWAQLLLIPLDVSNTRTAGGINMWLLWEILYCILAITIVILLPFFIFLYETDEEQTFVHFLNQFSRICSAFIYSIITIIVSCIIIFVSWVFLKYADIPVQGYFKSFTQFEDSDSQMLSQSQDSQSLNIQIKTSIIIYIIALTSFFGWILFSFFGGGIIALPFDLILAFKNKPKKITSQQAMEMKLQLKSELEQILEEGEKIKTAQKDQQVIKDGFWKARSAKNKQKSQAQQFINKAILFEDSFNMFLEQIDYASQNPCKFWGYLILGILLFIISIIIWTHMYIFKNSIIFEATRINNQIPTKPYLNTMLVYLDTHGAGFVATTLFSAMLIYLLFCAIKGTIKCGLRIPCIISLHPMKPNETFMNSFLVNILLMLLCSVSLIQFSTDIFSDYCRLTSIQMFFGNQIKHLKFFNYFYKYNVFGYMFIVLYRIQGYSSLTFFYLLICPRDKPKQLKNIEKHTEKKDKDKKKNKYS